MDFLIGVGIIKSLVESSSKYIERPGLLQLGVWLPIMDPFYVIFQSQEFCLEPVFIGCYSLHFHPASQHTVYFPVVVQRSSLQSSIASLASFSILSLVLSFLWVWITEPRLVWPDTTTFFHSGIQGLPWFRTEHWCQTQKEQVCSEILVPVPLSHWVSLFLLFKISITESLNSVLIQILNLVLRVCVAFSNTV